VKQLLETGKHLLTPQQALEYGEGIVAWAVANMPEDDQ
jgi:hypothetical protein